VQKVQVSSAKDVFFWATLAGIVFFCHYNLSMIEVSNQAIPYGICQF
jgi:hypothetical protein